MTAINYAEKLKELENLNEYSALADSPEQVLLEAATT